MRIALTADPEIPVPPHLYGGIERIVDMLAHGLVERGHDVTLFAHPDSSSAGRLIPWRGQASASKIDTLRNASLLGYYALKERYQIIHSFSRIAYMTPLLPMPIPKLMTYQREISAATVKLGTRISHGTLQFSAISQWMMQDVKHIGDWHMVPNGVPLNTYDFHAELKRDAPLVFLGRIEEIKGPHIAIEIARKTKLPLVIAGNIPDEYRGWYEKHVAPYIDGEQIRYIGPVDDVQKNILLGQARAFLMPILWEEPFGIVMAEAMACGTPVIGFRRGAVPEVVEDGITGFVRDSLDDLIECVKQLPTIDRAACRERVVNLYSADRVTEDYLRVYRKMLRQEHIEK